MVYIYHSTCSPCKIWDPGRPALVITAPADEKFWASTHQHDAVLWYKDPDYKPETVWRPPQVYNGIPIP